MALPRVAAIVPAYNEEQTIATVLEVLVASSHVDEVIVVSDGSTDRTVEIAKVEGATVVDLKENQGKGAAMLAGVKATKAPVIAFFDADLKGLSDHHVEQLVSPVKHGAKAMNVAMRDRGAFLTNLTRHLPLISGERALKREIIEKVKPEFLQGFMVESAMNYYCRTRGMTYGTVIFDGVTIRRKMEKVGVLKGMVGYASMSFQIVKSIVVVRVARLFNRF